MNSDTQPCLLIDAKKVSPALEFPDTIGKNIEILHGRRCEITNPDGTNTYGTFTIVRCLSFDRQVQDYFLKVTDTLINVLGTAPTELKLRKFIAGLMELFRALNSPAKKAARGLWAELFVIVSATDTARLLRAWHTTYTEPFDFSEGLLRIEVKSSSESIRRHHFTWEQLCPPLGIQVLVASLFVYTTDNGTSIRELADEIKKKVSEDHEIHYRIDSLIAEALGDTLMSSIDIAFDRRLAKDSLAFFLHQDIPAIREIPTGVSQVGFVSDLTYCSPLDRHKLNKYGELCGAAQPR